MGIIWGSNWAYFDKWATLIVYSCGRGNGALFRHLLAGRSGRWRGHGIVRTDSFKQADFFPRISCFFAFEVQTGNIRKTHPKKGKTGRWVPTAFGEPESDTGIYGLGLVHDGSALAHGKKGLYSHCFYFACDLPAQFI